MYIDTNPCWKEGAYSNLQLTQGKLKQKNKAFVSAVKSLSAPSCASTILQWSAPELTLNMITIIFNRQECQLLPYMSLLGKRNERSHKMSHIKSTVLWHKRATVQSHTVKAVVITATEWLLTLNRW